MNPIYSKIFWLDASERAIKTFAQVGAAMLLADGVNLFRMDWSGFFGVTLIATIGSILTSVASSTNGSNSASLVVEYVRKGK